MATISKNSIPKSAKSGIEGSIKSKLASGDFKVVDGKFTGKAEGFGAKVVANGLKSGKKIGTGSKMSKADIFWLCLTMIGLGAWVGVLIYQFAQERSKKKAEQAAEVAAKEELQKKAEQRLESKVEELSRKLAETERKRSAV